MKAHSFVKFFHFALILALLLAASGCNLPHIVGGLDSQTRAVLEDAIGELGNWPGEWQTTLTGVVDELGEVGSELAGEIGQEVERLMRATLQTAQEASFCEVDFFGIRVRQQLQAILHSYFPEDTDPAVFTPIICTISPTVIHSDSTSYVEYSGFDFFQFEESGIFSADLVYGDSGDLIQANFGTVNVETNYHIVVTFQARDFSSITASRQPVLVVRWNSESVEGQSEVPVIIVTTPAEPAPEAFVYELYYDDSYPLSAGGPNRGSGTASMACPPGSLLTGLWGSKGEYITGIGLICSPLNPDGTTGAKTTLERQGDNGGYLWNAMQCPADRAFAGVVGVYGGYVDRIQGICKSISDESDSMFTGWAGEGGFDEVEAACDAGDFVTGIEIRWGDYLDGLTLICTQVRRVAAPPASPGSASDFILVPTAAP